MLVQIVWGGGGGDINVENPPKRAFLTHFSEFSVKAGTFLQSDITGLYMRLLDVKKFVDNFAVLILPRPPKISNFAGRGGLSKWL